MKKNTARIPLSVPNLSDDLSEMIKDTLDSGWISTGGEYIDQFEKMITAYTEIPYAAALHSGTSGLYLSLKILGLKRDEEVLVPTATFVAAVNPITYLDAHPVFMDCDDTLNLDLDKVEKFLEEECVYNHSILINRSTGRRVRGIIPVDVFGNPVDMIRLRKIAESYNLFILEDATEALGSFRIFDDGSTGHAGTYADLTVLSFNANKIVTTAGGGMVLSHQKEYIDKIRHLSTQAKLDTPFFEHDEIGFNYRLSNLHATVGVSQMRRIEEFVETKRKNYFRYQEGINNIRGLSLLTFEENSRPNYWFYSLYVQPEFPLSRNELMVFLEERGISTRPMWKLIHTLKPYQYAQSYEIHKAYDYVEKILNIPCSTNLTDEEVDQVLEALKEAAEV